MATADVLANNRSFNSFYQKQFQRPACRRVVSNFFHHEDNDAASASLRHFKPLDGDGRHLVNTLVLNTDGSIVHQNTPEAEATYAVFRGLDHSENRSGILPREYRQDNDTAELYAVKIALDEINKILSNHGDPKETPHHPLNEISSIFFTIVEKPPAPDVFVIATDSRYVQHMVANRTLKHLKDRGFRKDSEKELILNADLIWKIDQMIEDLRARGVTVLFWWIDRRYNKHADKLARKAHTK